MINQLSIIIPTLNEEKYLPKLLASLSHQRFHGKMEVIVVDGESQDRTVSIASDFKKKFNDFTILKIPRGLGYQRNRGAAQAKYNTLLFLDADVILPLGFLESLQKKVKETENFIITTLAWVAEYDILSYFYIAWLLPITIVLSLSYHLVPGFLILTTKKNHEKIQGFLEDVKIGEDIDYSVRSRNAGARYRYFFTPVVLHSARRFKKMGRLNFLLFHLKNHPYVIKYGLKALSERIEYPYGNF